MTQALYWSTIASFVISGVCFFAGVPVRRKLPTVLALFFFLIGLGAESFFLIERFILLGEKPISEFFSHFPGSTTSETALYIVSFLALLTFLLFILLLRRRLGALSICFVVFLTLEMVLLDYLNFGRMPITTSFEYLITLTFWTSVGSLSVYLWLRSSFIGGIASFFVVLLLSFASLYSSGLEAQLVPALQSYWLQIHVALTIIGEAGFAAAFVAGILYLLKVYNPDLQKPSVLPRVIVCSLFSLSIGLLLSFILLKLATFQLPPGRGGISSFRKVLSFFGAGGVLALAFFYPFYHLLVRKRATPGLGGFIFAVTTVSLFISAELCGALVKKTERQIESLHKQYDTISELMREVHGELTKQAYSRLLQSCEDAISTILESRSVLPLPFRPEDLRDENRKNYEQLTNSLASFAISLPLPLYYKDLRKVELKLSERLSALRSLRKELTLPASRKHIEEYLVSLEKRMHELETSAIFPRTRIPKLSVFAGLSILLGIPILGIVGVVAYAVRPLIPKPDTLDRFGYKAVAFGYPIFSFGALIAGAVWAHFAWGAWWSWDPKEAGSLIVWLLYTIYLHERLRGRLGASPAAISAIIGFLACILTLVGNFILGGLHAYG